MTFHCPWADPGQDRCPEWRCDCFINLYPEDPLGLHPEAYAVLWLPGHPPDQLPDQPPGAAPAAPAPADTAPGPAPGPALDQPGAQLGAEEPPRSPQEAPGGPGSPKANQTPTERLPARQRPADSPLWLWCDSAPEWWLR